MSKNKKSSQFSRVYRTDETTLIPIIQGSPLFNAIITPEDFAKGLSPYIEIDNTEFVEKLDAIELELPNKVDKIDGYSLLADTEIEKLAALTDTGDIDLSAVELTENKQNSLEEDNTGVKFPTVDAVNEGLATKVDKEAGKSLVDDEEILRLSSVVNQDISNLVEKEEGKSLILDTEIARLATLENVSIEHLATKDELSGKVDKEVGKSLIADEEILRLSTVTNQDISNLASKDELDNLVVKEVGKSLILDTEIERLESVTNQTLEGLGAEDVNNKKSLLNPLSETEYPNSKAVADYVTDGLSNLELTGDSFTGSEVDLSNPLGAYQVATANTSTAYTLSANKVIGGWSKIKINATTEPTVTDGIKITGSDFTASTDMYLLAEYNGTTTEYYFAEI